jgi:hypothetical protein
MCNMMHCTCNVKTGRCAQNRFWDFRVILVLNVWVLTNRCDMVHMGRRRILLPEGMVSILGQSVWNVFSVVAVGQISVRVLPFSPVTTTPSVLLHIKSTVINVL